MYVLYFHTGHCQIILNYFLGCSDECGGFLHFATFFASKKLKSKLHGLNATKRLRPIQLYVSSDLCCVVSAHSEADLAFAFLTLLKRENTPSLFMYKCVRCYYTEKRLSASLMVFWCNVETDGMKWVIRATKKNYLGF